MKHSEYAICVSYDSHTTIRIEHKPSGKHIQVSNKEGSEDSFKPEDLYTASLGYRVAQLAYQEALNSQIPIEGAKFYLHPQVNEEKSKINRIQMRMVVSHQLTPDQEETLKAHFDDNIIFKALGIGLVLEHGIVLEAAQ